MAVAWWWALTVHGPKGSGHPEPQPPVSLCPAPPWQVPSAPSLHLSVHPGTGSQEGLDGQGW